MSDKNLPDYKNEPSEFGSRKVVFPRPIQLQMDMIKRKIMQAHTLVALKQLTDDIQHSIIASKPAAKTEMRQIIERRARELGYKSAHNQQFWG